MPYAPHVRIRLNGIFGSVTTPAEIFSYGLATNSAGLPNPTQVNNIVTACQTYHGAVGTNITSACRLTEVAISLVGGNGLQVGETIRRAVSTAGGGVGPAHPPQVAMRISIDDGLRGRSHRGGWYVPGINTAVSATDMTIAQAEAVAAVATARTFMTAIAGAGDAPVVIASGVLGNLVVTRVRVGRALDTIRRRRNNLVEGYQVGTVP